MHAQSFGVTAEVAPDTTSVAQKGVRYKTLAKGQQGVHRCRGFTPTPNVTLLSLLNILLAKTEYARKGFTDSVQKFFPAKRRHVRCRGFIALTSVLVLGAVLLSIAISTASRSIGTANLGTSLYSKASAESLADLCAQHALIELQRTLGYSGDESIAVGDESCDILTISGTGNTDRTVKTMSTVSGHTHRLFISVQVVSPSLDIDSWNEVSNF
jgi:hypothetical protein